MDETIGPSFSICSKVVEVVECAALVERVGVDAMVLRRQLVVEVRIVVEFAD